MEYKIQQQIIFFKVVIEKYNIDKALTPINCGDGELDNVTLSDLRKKLDFCFNNLEYYSEKEFLIDYIEDHNIALRYNIKSQKLKVKRLKKDIKHLRKKNDCDKANETDYKNEQEESILIYLTEQQFFIRSWVNQKRTEYNELTEKEVKSKEREREIIKKLLAEVTKDKLINKYEDVFLNAQSYHLFNDYINSVTVKHLTEFSFIYRIMISQGLIKNTVKVNFYKRWLNDEFEQDFTTIKQLSTISIKYRLEKYNTIKELYKPLDPLKQ